MTRYELLDRIGIGGMAEIFRGKAVAAGGFEKPVAIKRILPHLCQDQRFVRLLIAEAKILSLLRHRNIVQIFDVGLGEDQQHFLVMEFVDGVDLGSIQAALEKRRRRLPVDLVLFIGAELCDALDYAQNARSPDGQPMRLVHRDVSPSNVLLSRSGEVKLTDFGIAKRAEEVTSHGAVRGKFAYISPEQARNQPVSARSDVFSLGVLMFEMLLGRRLYSALPDLDALRAVRGAAVPRPRDVDPGLSPAIEEVLLTALAGEPMKRFASAGEMGSRLRSLRYSLDELAGDPATELGKIVEGVADSMEHQGKRSSPRAARPSESSVFRLRAHNDFHGDQHTAILQARQIVDRFEQEETRLAHLSGEQINTLRSGAGQVGRESGPTDAAVQAPIFGDSEATNIQDVESLLASMDGGRNSTGAQPIAELGSAGGFGAPPPPIAGIGSGGGFGEPPPPNASPNASPNGYGAYAQEPYQSHPPLGAIGAGGEQYVPPSLALAPLGSLAHVPERADPTAPARPAYSDFDPSPAPTGARPSMPVVDGFARPPDSQRTWIVVVGSLIVGLLAFGITRVVLDKGSPADRAVSAPSDAALAAPSFDSAPPVALDASLSGAAASPVDARASDADAATAGNPNRPDARPADSDSASTKPPRGGDKRRKESSRRERRGKRERR